MRLLLLALLLVSGFSVPGSAASTAGALPYNLVLSPRPTSSSGAGTVTGRFGGVSVEGTYNGNSSSGTFTLTVKGATFVAGMYSCVYSGCTFTGTMVGKRVTAIQMSALSGVGHAASGVFPTREVWISAVSDWANAQLGSDQAASIVAAAASVKMPQTLNEQGHGSGNGGESGGHGGMGGGDGGMGGKGGN